MYSIVADQLTKQFGTFTAVDHISFQVKRGEIFGFLGANGAGKTTAIKMMSGLLLPTSGTATIAGYDVLTQSKLIKKNIGYMSQRFSLYNDLTVFENMQLFGTIYKIPRKELKDRIYDSLRQLDMEKQASTLVSSIPLGWKQKLAFATAILHRPDIVFLDEPTIGLDVSMKSKIRELILGLNKEKNTTVILTTHDMGDVDALCKRIVIIDKGTKIYDNDIDHLKTYFGSYRTLKLKRADDTWEETLIDDKTTDVMDVIMEKRKTIKIKDVKIDEISTEEVIKKIYEGSAK